MSLSSHFHFPAETAKVTDIKQLAAFMTIAKMTRSVTVRINNCFGGGGFGVIIHRQGNIYAVLTAHHVVERPGIKYTIHTNKGNGYAVTEVIRLQQCDSEFHIAVVQFFSPDAYPVATFGNSDAALIGTNIYVSGYPANIHTQGREFTFTNGIIIDRPNRELLRYNAPTWSGMSGAPVFNASVRVIGIHVAREFDLHSKTGFNMAVPINTCIALLNQTELSCSDWELALTQDNKDSQLRINPNDAPAYLPLELSHAVLGCKA